MVYYGLALNVGNMGGNIYLNFLIVTLIEFPAVLICFPTLDLFGRRIMNCAVMLLAGFACIGATFSSVYGGDGE